MKETRWRGLFFRISFEKRKIKFVSHIILAENLSYLSIANSIQRVEHVLMHNILIEVDHVLSFLGWI